MFLKGMENVIFFFPHIMKNMDLSLLFKKYFKVLRKIFISNPLYGEGNGTPLQYSCLENPMDGGAWWATVHGIAESWTRLSDFTFTFHSYAWEKEMAAHQTPLFLGFSRQEHWSGLPFPSPMHKSEK